MHVPILVTLVCLEPLGGTTQTRYGTTTRNYVKAVFYSLAW